MNVADQAQEIIEDLTDKLGQADTLINEAATGCAGLAKLFQGAGGDYADEAAEAAAWTSRLVTGNPIPDILSEMEGEEADAPGEDDPITIVTTLKEARLISKVLQFAQQLDSSEFDGEILAGASLTYQLKVG